jgi:predicted dehydrogenase
MTKNVLVIGVGPHARRSHLPALAAGQSAGLVGAVCGVDIVGAADALVPYDADDGPRSIPVTLIEAFDSRARALPDAVRRTLDALAVRRRIDAVVVATEPAVHMPYTHWALERGLSVLLDKPLSVRAEASTDPAQAAAILTDYDELITRYEHARRRHPGVLVSVMSQRRYHPAFWRMRDLIHEVADKTGCPVTSVQAFHSDGQWRLPDELIGLDYHGYDQGYGKCAHSGYHFFDIVPWLIDGAASSGKTADTVEVHAHIARPADFLHQLSVGDHEQLFTGFITRNPYSAGELNRLTHGFGETDAFLSLAFRNGPRTLTLGSINLVHTGFSQRGTLAPAAALYKGNGRVRQETLILQQGPFQALHFHSLQTLPGSQPPGHSPYETGGDKHVELHVFRNDRHTPCWKAHQRLDFEALTGSENDQTAKPTQQSSRRRAVQEFLEYINGKRDRAQMRSEVTSHRPAVTLMTGAYLSMANRWTAAAPTAELSLRPPAAARSRVLAEAAL